MAAHWPKLHEAPSSQAAHAAPAAPQARLELPG
jgi:hypothetical protein